MLKKLRLTDAVLLVVGLALLGWATVLVTRPEPREAPSTVAMRTQQVVEGRSAHRSP
jgi:hypothetical protein